MREEVPIEPRSKASKFADQNQPPRPNNGRGNQNSQNPQKARSSWGSNIIKGLEKKTKSQTTTLVAKKQPLEVVASNKNPVGSNHPRVKRSLIGDLVSPAQVHPQGYHRRQSSGSRDLFLELDHLRGLLQESKEREFKLQAEVAELKRNGRVQELEGEVDELYKRIGVLESDKSCLLEQANEAGETAGKKRGNGSVEMEVLELRRLNKELQMEKRSLSCKVSFLESQLASLPTAPESDVVAKIKAEASQLRDTNDDLSKQVEGLQMSRLNEVEELAYLRWVNSCLRDELSGSCSKMGADKNPSSDTVDMNSESIETLSCPSNEFLDHNSAKRINLIKKLKKWPITDEDLSGSELSDRSSNHSEEGRSPRRRHSISGSKFCIDDLMPSKRRQSDGFMCIKDMEKEDEEVPSKTYNLCIAQGPQVFGYVQEANKIVVSLDVKKRELRVPNPPPRPSFSLSSVAKEEGLGQAQAPPPPPPPPPLPPKFAVRSASTGVVQRAPQVVEFYHSLMKRDSKKDSCNGAVCEASDFTNARSSMIGEIENRSSHLLAIKADVETQGEFVNSLIREVNNAAYKDIDDVVAFVKWLDDELGFLVDERAVLKHFDWPEKKADTLREAAFGYCDLMKLESEVSYYKDDPRMPCDLALKKMVTLSEKMEHTVYNLLRTRDSLMRNCKEFHIPTDWMLDNGIISKIKFCSVKLAKKYMKRVATEIQSKATLEKDPALDYTLLQGVRFAFRIHQFAGGFDAETMHAFEELRNLSHLISRK